MPWFQIITFLFSIVSVSMILIILVQRPQGGGLAGAFGGAGGGGADTVFGGRVGDALTWATVVAFVLFLGLATAVNLIPITPGPVQPAGPAVGAPEDGSGTAPATTGDPAPAGAGAGGMGAPADDAADTDG